MLDYETDIRMIKQKVINENASINQLNMLNISG
jgi:hypothetical protein